MIKRLRAHQNVEVSEESFNDGVEGVTGEVGDEGVRQVKRKPKLVAHCHAEVPCFHRQFCQITLEAAK